MKQWSEMEESEKDAARERYAALVRDGMGSINIAGHPLAIGPMDPATAQGLTVDAYLEKTYSNAPKLLKAASRIQAILSGRKQGNDHE